MTNAPRSVAICLVLLCGIALADDFKTINGKEYKNATVSRVEPDGIVLKSKSGISKVYFVELPKEVQERFHYDAAAVEATAKAAGDATAKKQQAIEEKNRKFREQMAQLQGSLFILKGKVLQVLKDGIFVTDVRLRPWEFTPDGRADADLTHQKHPDLVPLDEIVYLETDPAKFFDGDSVSETFACDYGAFNYTTSAGITKKIRALTVNHDHGVEYARRNQ
jgi:hypothetical protein